MNQDIIARLETITNIALFVLGILFSAFALAAEVFGYDLTPGFGMVQMAQLLIGLTCQTLAGYLRIYGLRPAEAPRSLQADIGVRLGATGLVFAYTTGWADLIGIGTHVEPEFTRPFVGPLQLGGLILGVLMITIGMLLYYTSRGSRESSVFGGLFPNGAEEGG